MPSSKSTGTGMTPVGPDDSATALPKPGASAQDAPAAAGDELAVAQRDAGAESPCAALAVRALAHAAEMPHGPLDMVGHLRTAEVVLSRLAEAGSRITEPTADTLRSAWDGAFEVVLKYPLGTEEISQLQSAIEQAWRGLDRLTPDRGSTTTTQGGTP